MRLGLHLQLAASLLAGLVLLVQCAALSPDTPFERRDLGDGLVLCDGKVHDLFENADACGGGAP